MERLTEWLPAGTVANVKYPDGADAVKRSAYRQKAIDRLAAYEGTGCTQEEINEIVFDDVFGIQIARLRELAEAALEAHHA